MAEKAHLNVYAVAKYFGVKVSTVYRLAQQRQLPGFKVGGQWRFNKQLLDAWVANRSGTPTGHVRGRRKGP